jgi:enamine deaminase RidA (YjgF/YER057c/UK114 family)
LIFVSGTTATDEQGECPHPGDLEAQTAYVFRRIKSALDEAGASLTAVTRTRIFLRHGEDSDVVARAHARVFGDVCPANSLLRGEPLDPAMLVEIEVDAVLEDGS